MDAQEKLFDFLRLHTIAAETIEHAPARTVEDTKGLSLPHTVCKNLFLKDRRKKLWLLVALPDTKIQLKKLAKEIDAPELRFAQPELLKEVLGVEPGAVSLFGILNDTDKRVTILIDKRIFTYKTIGFHPYVHNKTTFIKTMDIYPFIKACGFSYKEIEFDEA